LHCPAHEVAGWVPRLREKGCRIILWEPWDEFCVPENEALFKQNSAQVDIVSPNLREARMLTGIDDPEDVIIKLRDYGAQIVALRMAEAGSLVVDQHGHLYRIPALPVEKIIDVTGAGNAFCGGFIVGYAKTGDAHKAGWCGGVSASLALHQFGALYPLDHLRQEAELRLNWYQEHAQQV
jgi:sugar/nucleoside kinase (ribokinase family)